MQPTTTAADPEEAAMSRSPFLRAALDAAARGWKVFPVIPDGKTPAIGDWQRRASSNRRQSYGWRADNSRKNIGIATGPSGVVVIDLDDSHGAGAVRRGAQRPGGADPPAGGPGGCGGSDRHVHRPDPERYPREPSLVSALSTAT